MKRLKSILATLAMLLCAISASAEEFSADGIYYNITDSEKLTVAVTYRGSSSNSHRNEYTGSVVIPETVTYNNQTYSVTSIGKDAFRSCSSLASVTIGNGVTSIGDDAFYNTAWYNNQPDGIVYVGNFACGYKGTMPYNASIVIADGTLAIADYAFSNYSTLKSVSFPNSVTSIGYSAFSGCSSLTSVTIPDGVTSIGTSAFHGCSSLTSVTIPDGVTSIGSYAFCDCRSLTSITIPNSITSIGNSAFDGCSSLASVTIGNGVTSIGSYAFSSCTGMDSLSIYAVDIDIDIKAFNNCTIKIIYLNLRQIEYMSIDNSKIQQIVLGDSVVNISDEAFKDCNGLKSLVIGKNTKSIGNWAFYNCSNLTSLTIPNSVVNIGDYAFRYGSNLASVTIGNGVTSIGVWAFYGCSSLTSITIPDGVTIIGDGAFSNCSNLTSITIPNSVTSIGDGAFYECSSLTSITIPQKLACINNHVFTNCSKLSYVSIGNSIKSIGKSAFHNCRNLNSLTLPESVETIDQYAFAGCNFKKLYCLPELIPIAHSEAFYNTDIDTLYVPEKLINHYKAYAPWSSIMNIVALSDDDEPIAPDPETPAPPSTTLTIGSTGSTTFSSLYNLDFSNVNGIKAYTATGYNSDNGELTLVRIKEAKAGSGLYVSGKAGTYIIPTISSTAYNSLNMFVGVNEETTISTTDGRYTNYIYTKPSGKDAGFYKVTTDRAIPAGKAYLQIPTVWLNEETTSEAKAVKLVFDDGESTGIDEVNRVESKEDVIYDLQGRRVKNPSRGIYIINGRKVVR